MHQKYSDLQIYTKISLGVVLQMQWARCLCWEFILFLGFGARGPAFGLSVFWLTLCTECGVPCFLGLILSAFLKVWLFVYVYGSDCPSFILFLFRCFHCEGGVFQLLTGGSLVYQLERCLFFVWLLYSWHLTGAIDCKNVLQNVCKNLARAIPPLIFILWSCHSKSILLFPSPKNVVLHSFMPRQ